MSATPTEVPTTDTTQPDPPAMEEKPLLNPREEELFKVAMLHCLKSGAPEIDMQKFFTRGGFKTLKTAQNTWGKIKAKLPKAEAEGEGEGGVTPKAKVTLSKRSAKKAEVDGDDDEEAGDGDGSPKKKPRKTPTKKTPGKKGVKKEVEEEDEDAIKYEAEN